MMIKITAIRQTVYRDLIARYENPIEHACDVRVGDTWWSREGECPAGFCPEAWATLRPFAEALARGEGNFYDGWMKNPRSAMLSCNDGFRPVSFHLEVVDDERESDK
ncbi:MAG: TIGR04076 family protein [Muribaculaceae bacterium]|nr:TIGR04076 family protein [Muribaculaceae bacterium]